MILIDNAEQLSKLILQAINPPGPAGMTLWHRIRDLVLLRWPVKLGSLGLVIILWLMLAGQQNFEVNLTVPLEPKNIPEKMAIVDPLNPEVQITVRGLRKDASTLNRRNVHAEVDLSSARFGNRVFRVTRDQILLPTDRVHVVRVAPPQMGFKFRETPGGG